MLFFFSLMFTAKDEKFVVIITVAGQQLCQHFRIIMQIKIRNNDSDKFTFSVCQNFRKFIFFIAKGIKGLRNFFLIFKCKGIRMIEIS